MTKKVVIDGVEYVPKGACVGMAISKIIYYPGKPIVYCAGRDGMSAWEHDPNTATYEMEVTNAKGEVYTIKINVDIFRKLCEVVGYDAH